MLAFVIMRDIHRHVDAEDLEKYSMGLGTPEQTAHVEEHLLTCEDCQSMLQKTDSYVLAMRSAAGRFRRSEKAVKAARRHERKFFAWFPVMAVAACALLLVVAIGLRSVSPPGPAVAVSLTALRSNGSGSAAPAGRPLLLHPDLTGLSDASTYPIEIVDQSGRVVRQSILTQDRNGVLVPTLHAGQYFVRVYLPTGELLREYGLVIQ